MISIIIRSKNEERWISQCLESVARQQVDEPIEVILVDNKSTDKTVEKALKKYPSIKVLSIDKFIPGLAINKGIKASKGKYIVCLSAHCIAVNNTWLQRLKDNLGDQNIAGVYGRQVPLQSTNNLDRRDLLLTFGVDRRIQIKDSFFHNANSMFRKSVWSDFPFDEKATNIEDRIWGKKVVNAGLKIVYEPNAEVYHYHGIHQSRDSDRCSNIIKIMNKMENMPPIKEAFYPQNVKNIKAVAFIPWDSSTNELESKLVKYSINAAINAKYIDKVVVLTSDRKCKEVSEELGAWVPFLRPKKLSVSQSKLGQVLKYSLEQLEDRNYYPDVVTLLSATYPLRSLKLIDTLVERLLLENADTAIAGYEEYRPSWLKGDSSNFIRIDDYVNSKQNREPLQIGIPGLGCASFSDIVRTGDFVGEVVAIYKVKNIVETMEIKTKKDLNIFNIVKHNYLNIL